MEAIVLVVTVGALIWLGVIAYQRYQAAIRARWQRMASLSGLAYSNHDPWLEALPFDLLQAGDGRAVDHVLSGTYSGVPTHGFEYHYYEDSTDAEGRTSRTYHRFTCAVVPCDLAAPHLKISRESIFSKLAGALGFDDIQFESEDFNRTFRVTATDRRFASYVVDARMMEHLLAGERFAYEIRDGHILAYGARRDVEQIRGVLDAAVGFRARVPRAALDVYGQR